MRRRAVCGLWLAAVLLLTAPAVFASDDSGAAGTFMYEGGSGARSAGLANSCSADSSDASGGYFNPALVTTVKNTELSFYYMSPADGVGYSVLSFALPVMEYGMLAFTRVELSVDGIERITAEGIKTGDFSDRSDAYLLTYGYPVTDRLSLGLTLKLVTRSFDTYNSNGFGVDAGATYDFGRVFTVSLSFQNIAQPALKTGTVTENCPMNMRAGGALYLFDRRLSFMCDLLVINLLQDGSQFADGGGSAATRWSGGAEFKPFDFAAVRAGVNTAGPAVGAGVTTENFTIDYAALFAPAGVVHNFGVTARFGEVPTEREKRLMQEKEGLAKDKEALFSGLVNVSYEQLYLMAQNDYDTGNYDKAAGEIKSLQEMKSGDARVDKLNADLQLALNRRAAGVKFDQAVTLLKNGEKKRGFDAIKEAERISPGITVAKTKEYMDRGSSEIADRRYSEAAEWYEGVLAVDPSNAKAAEMLGKLKDLSDMAK